MSETPYVETEALLAVMNQDFGRMQELLDGMTRGELREFGDQVAELHGAVVRAWSRGGARLIP
jgi:hypothetical protein